VRLFAQYHISRAMGGAPGLNGALRSEGVRLLAASFGVLVPGQLGVRLIAGPLAGAMCPIFQTSANHSGEPAPAHFADVPEEIVAAADLAIDGGTLAGLPSTVIDLTAFEHGGEWGVLREGGMSLGDLAARLADL